MQWHIKSVKLEEKVNVEENFRKEKTTTTGDSRKIQMSQFLSTLSLDVEDY